MKKIIALLMTVALVLSLGVSVFAQKGGFVYSPTVTPGLELIDIEYKDHECPAETLVTPYGDRDELPDDTKELLEEAYDAIVNVKDGDDLDKILDEYAKELGLPNGSVLVSELLDISFFGCEEHNGHTPFVIKLTGDSLDNFVGVVTFKDGKWAPIADATVDNNGLLIFTADGYGPYAILVDASEVDSPITGADVTIIVCVALMAVSALGLVAVYAFSRKKNAAKAR